MKKNLDTLIMAGLARSLSSNQGSVKNFFAEQLAGPMRVKSADNRDASENRLYILCACSENPLTSSD